MKQKMLGDICDFINGDRGKNYPSGKDFVQSGVPFINAGHIKENKIDLDNMNYITEEKFEILGSGKVKRNDVLYCLRGSLGKTAVVEIEKGAIASSLVILRPKENIVNTNYLIKYLNSNKIQEQINRANNGSSQPNLSAASVKSFIIDLPSYDNQIKIAEVLDTAQELIDKRKEQIDSLDELVKSKFIEMFGDPVINKKKWQVRELLEVAILLNGRAYKQDELLDEGKTPVLRVGNFFSNRNWFYSDLELEEEKYCENGDLLYAWSASFGPKIWDGGKVIYHYHIWKLVVDEDKINKIYLYWVLNLLTDFLKSNTHGATMLHLTKSGMEKNKIILPPLELQNKFVDFIVQVDKLKVEMEKSLKEHEENFNSLMQKALKGELFN